ncbi:hypothetical protein GPJ56_001096 [Histomonas meleagridis]|uniref:uncharacterized protein n=1 Tax=Histomonas meleagridis TaxID=135588 RepID=UPI003559871F|nr:hypothetical protein GPJ56_001096 [Histomonas meleagridis]KAH0798456.1 hypothetical protein GO595_008726 [Histomonas meleagridis]
MEQTQEPNTEPSDISASTHSDGSNEKQTRNFVCNFGPIIGSLEEYDELFRREKFDTFVDLCFIGKHGSIKFPSQAEADLFIEHFSNFEFKGQQMWAEKPRRLQNGVKTLHLSGFTPGNLSERSIFFALSGAGFIRRISGKRDFAFVEFDTPEEAQNVLKQYPTIQIDGDLIKLSFARTEHNPKLTIPLKELVPLDHPFWYQLQEMLYEQTLH